MGDKEKEYRDSQKPKTIDEKRSQFLINSLIKAQKETSSKKYPREER